MNPWRTIYDVDYSLFANQDIQALGDGVFATQDGITAIAANMANANACEVILGTGLNINAAVSAYDEVTTSAPVIAIPLNQFVGGIYGGPLNGVRITALLTSENLTNDGDVALFCLDQFNGNVPDSSFQRYEWSLAQGDGAKGHRARLMLRAANVVLDDDALYTPVSDSALQIEVPRVGHSLALLRTGAGLTEFQFPYAGLVPRNELSSPSPFHSHVVPDMVVVLGATSAAGGTSVVWQRLRIEALVG